jgi:hypothetical protein
MCCVWLVLCVTKFNDARSLEHQMLVSILFTVSLDVPQDVTWIKINCHQKGYYRVNYSKENWEKLIELLKNDFMVSTGA